MQSRATCQIMWLCSPGTVHCWISALRFHGRNTHQKPRERTTGCPRGRSWICRKGNKDVFRSSDRSWTRSLCSYVHFSRFVQLSRCWGCYESMLYPWNLADQDYSFLEEKIAHRAAKFPKISDASTHSLVCKEDRSRKWSRPFSWRGKIGLCPLHFLSSEQCQHVLEKGQLQRVSWFI